MIIALNILRKVLLMVTQDKILYLVNQNVSQSHNKPKKQIQLKYEIDT